MSIFQKTKTKTIRLRQLGFTLLELVLVLFLIGLLASAGLLFTENIESQQQYEETVERYERIRKAIIQSGERTVNGRPELRGFAVDMGRLPYCLAELTYTEGVSSSNTDYFVSPCEPINKFKLARPGVTENGIRYGWHGPYIQVSPDSDGIRRYRDGYQNDGGQNFGWIWEVAVSAGAERVILADYTPSSSQLLSSRLESLGFDINDPNDNYPSRDINDNLPELVSKNEWTVELGTMDVLFVNTSATSDFAPSDSDQNWNITISRSGSPLPEYQSSTFTFTQPISSGGTYQQDDVGINKRLPAGFYNFSINCKDDDGLPSEDECPSGESGHSILQLSPNHQAPTEFRWEFSP